MATVQLKQIRKSYDAFEIIKGVDLTIHDQELTVFVGPSGCGKSTLLRLIAGLEDITSGDLLIDGQRMNEVPPARRGLAIVFQSYALYPHMNVAENMSFSLKLAGIPKAERDRKVLQAAHILNLETFLDRKPKALSGGQRQRVAIGRAIVRDPKVFLFDEPLSNLDAALRVRMRLELTKLHRQLRATMIYVTHDQVEAMTMADRIVVLQGGIVEQVGSPMELYRYPRNLFVAGFIGSPRMNFVAASVQQTVSDGVVIVLSNGATLHVPVNSAICAGGDQVTLGIRPEHIAVVAAGDLAAQVQAVEHLGSESYLHLAIQSGELLTIRVNGETTVQPDQQVQLKLDPGSLHLFDRHGSAMRLAPAESPNGGRG
ncbi:MAG: sn-glycerol-3-phosphate ABC transporter ATP-binding protein UgpC [Nitrospirota bacterium]|nr:sn-glycerol-3-phosphate ABC transporter ATP-binding protein UgpC [Nitrospirota bacterium]